MSFNRGQLYVLDNAIERIVALDAETSALRWKVGRRGAGPEEFAGIASLFPDRDGGVAVVDIQNRRITRVSALGKVLGAVSTGTMGQQPNQVCPFGDNRFLVADVFQPLLLEFDSTGALIERLSPIWPDLANARLESYQVTLHSDATSTRCLVALGTGRGFALLFPGQKPVVGRYVEEFDVYGVGARKDEGKIAFWATYDAAFVADTVLMLFAGKTPDKYRLVDRYSATSGEYLDTYRLPSETGRFAAGGGMLFVLDTSRTMILALRPRP
jgi:hypothetical protein